MRVLFDHGTPVPLRRALTRHIVSTAYEIGWAELDNGELLKAAEAQFDALVGGGQRIGRRCEHARQAAGAVLHRFLDEPFHFVKLSFGGPSVRIPHCFNASKIFTTEDTESSSL